MPDFYEFLERNCHIRLNSGQQEAVTHLNGPCLTLAVPGSGKTTMLLCRTLHLQAVHQVPPASILSLTFSRAAADDMKRRYSELFGTLGNARPFFSTIHAFSYGLLRSHLSARRLEEPKLLSDGSGGDRNRLLLQITRDMPGLGANDEKLEEIGNRISYFKNMMLTPEHCSAHLPERGWQTEIPTIYQRYELAKKKNNLMDFDDMLSAAYSILEDDPKAAAQVKNRYQFIQVDESQDTSKVQHGIIRLLLGPEMNLFMVADDDQSIYGFRGAFPEMILNFKKEFPNGKLCRLTENYRSAGNIIEVCTQVIKHNQARFIKEMKATTKNAGEVRMIDFHDHIQRNDFLTQSLSTVQVGTVGILYRNNLSAVSVANSLMTAGIDFQIKDGSGSFFEHWVVRDLTDILNFALFRQDMALFERIYYKMNGFISKDWLEQGKQAHRGGSVLRTLLDRTNPGKWQKDNVMNMENLLDRIAEAPPEMALEIAAHELGYYDFMVRRCDKAGLSKETARTVFDTLVQLSRPHKTAAALFSALDELKTTLKASRTSAGAPVRLSTIHGAKGLEYDHVILLDMDKGVLPSSKATDEFETGEPAAYEEERRLFYVALSRARGRLDLCRVKFRNGARLYPSPFITEMTGNPGTIQTSDFSIQHNRTPNTSGTKQDPGEGLFEASPAIGDRIEHLKFGYGEVLRISGDSITLQFSDALRTLSLRLCIEKGLLRL